MLIKYNPEEIALENQLVVESDNDNINTVFIPSFTITDLAYDSEFVYGKVYGNEDSFKTLNTNNYTEIDALPAANIEYFIDGKYRTPTTIDAVLKLQLRSKLEDEIGDTEDILADLYKRATLIERLLFCTVNDLLTTSPEKLPVVNAGYKSFVDNYMAAMQAYDTMSVTDLEDPQELFAKLMDRSIRTTKIVKENYTDKKTGQ